MSNIEIQNLSAAPLFRVQLETGNLQRYIDMYLTSLQEKGSDYFYGCMYDQRVEESTVEHYLVEQPHSEFTANLLAAVYARMIILEAVKYNDEVKKTAVAELFQRPSLSGEAPDLFDYDGNDGRNQYSYMRKIEKSRPVQLAYELRNITSAMLSTPDAGSDVWECSVMEAAIGEESVNVNRWKTLISDRGNSNDRYM